jgi:hypothetical protein
MTSVADASVKKSITVDVSVEQAFKVFTSGSTAGGRAAITSANRRSRPRSSKPASAGAVTRRRRTAPIAAASSRA